jgi:hypothetical protein
LQGEIFDPPIKRLTNRVLRKWYFNHYNHEDGMPFGHDISDPFTYPYIKYHSPRPFTVKKNEFEVYLNDMKADEEYPLINFEDSKYEVRKNKKGELELLEVKG